MMKLFGKKRREQGDVAEHQAKCHLKAHGLRTVEQNVRSRFGKVELIMRHGPVRVFVEMRFRRSVAFGGALASVDAKNSDALSLPPTAICNNTPMTVRAALT